MKFSASTFIVKQSDLDPDIQGNVTTDAGANQDLTGATLTFSMRDSRTQAVKVNAAVATLVTPAAGLIKYAWAGTDTDTPATYEGTFRVTPAAGDPYRVPTDGYLVVIVEPKVA